jgi:hypothetical protein
MRLPALALVLVLALAGCGGDDAERPAEPRGYTSELARAAAALPAGEGGGQAVGDPQPTLAARRARPAGAVRAALDAGAAAVVDLTGRLEIRPATLDVAKDARVEGIEWSRWDGAGAEGEGRLEAVRCDPDCARGVREAGAVRIRLSRPTACARGRFFDRAVVTPVPGPDAVADRTTSWIAAPC